MHSSRIEPRTGIADAVAAYRETGDYAALLARLDAVATAADADALTAAVEPFRDLPEVAGPVYERIVAERPGDAHALVTLASCYWLTGRGAEPVADLASRAIAADAAHRGGWHLWALTEPSLRERVGRWAQVAERFPDDELARATLADNAASLASTEHDDQALALAIQSYESLLPTARHPAQREAVERALQTLRAWRL